MKTQETKRKKIREFEHEGSKYHLYAPNAKNIKDSKFAYSKAFTGCLRQDLFTRKQLEDQLKKENEKFFEQYNSRRAELIENIRETEQNMSTVEEPESLSIMAQMMLLYRAQLFEEDRMMNELFGNSADQIAEEERIINLVIGTVTDSKDVPCWSSYDEVMEEADTKLLEACKYQVMCAEYDLDPDWQDKLPEVVAQDRIQEMKDKREEEEAKKKEEEKAKAKETKDEPKPEEPSKPKAKRKTSSRSKAKTTRKKSTTAKRKSSAKASK